MNGVRDSRRRAARKPWQSLTDLLRSRTDKPRAQAIVTFDQTRTGLSDALAQNIKALPDEFREVFVLHHLQELDLNQIAEIQGVPIGTVKSRLGRARERMRAAMKPWLDGDEAK
jgi:RNA polymerase sigma-70 factor (ECF subfamily)